MPIRWVASPIVEFVDPEDPTRVFRRPYVATLEDPGRPGKEYVHSSTYFDSRGIVLSFVSGADLSPLDSDGDITDILERDYEEIEDFLDSTPNQEGWTGGKINSTRNRLANVFGADMTGVDGDTPFSVWLDRAVEAELGPAKGPRGHSKEMYAKRGN